MKLSAAEAFANRDAVSQGALRSVAESWAVGSANMQYLPRYEIPRKRSGVRLSMAMHR